MTVRDGATEVSAFLNKAYGPRSLVLRGTLANATEDRLRGPVWVRPPRNGFLFVMVLHVS